MEKGKKVDWVPASELLTRYTTALEEKLINDFKEKDLTKLTMHPEDFMSHVYDFSESAYLTVSNGL